MANQIVVSAGAKVRNLSGVLTATCGVVSFLPIDVSLGIPQLDVNGKILVSQLPNSVMEYKGTWDASTNTPTLANGTGNQGDVYLCSVAGTVNFGAGAIAFFVGDQVIYSGSIWQRASGATGTVTSVAVTESGDSLNITGSPITTSGTINIGFNGTNLQYVNGAGNLTTFPILTGYVTAVSGTAPVVSSGGTTPAISMAAATGSVDGYLSATDFAIFNAKQSALTFSSPLVNTSGTISIPAATTSVNGYLASADFTTFNNKQNAITLTTTGTSGVATLVGATLNIPNYGSALTGYVPYTGATQDVDLGAFSLNGKSLHIKGTAGNGHLGLKHQSAAATGSANESLIYADSLGDLSWQNANLYLSKFITSANTANRSYTFPNATCNIPDDSLVVHLAGTETITGAKTFSGYTTFTSTVDITSGLTFSNSGFTLLLQPPTLSVNRTVTLPDGTGTLALTSDISYPVTSVFGRTGAVVATSGDYTTAQVTEVTNLYFTDSRARLALSFVAGSGAYNSTTGVITIPTNNNQITNGSNYITLGSLSAGVGISYNNTTGVITNSAPDQVVALTASTGISVTGTYPNFTITNTSPSSGGTVTSVAALTIGTTGTDLSSSVANSTTTPVITLNVPTASATNRGALSSADWTTFNNKQPQLNGTGFVKASGTTITYDNSTYLTTSSAASTYLPLAGGTLTGALGGTSASFTSNVTALGNSNVSSAIVANNGLGGSGTAQYYQDFGNGSGFVAGRILRGNGASGLEGNGLNIDNYAGFKVRLNQLGGSGGSFTIDGGNLGLGVTPGAWFSGTKALQINGGSMYAANLYTFIGSNIVYTSVGDQYINTGFATAYGQTIGEHRWYNAPSGTAGNAITFTQAMTLFSDGNLLLTNGTVSNAGYKLDVNGTGRFSAALTVVGINSTSANNTITGYSADLYALAVRQKGASAGISGTNFMAQLISAIGAEGLEIYTPNAKELVLGTNSTPRLTIASTGAATFSSSVSAGGTISASDYIQAARSSGGYLMGISNTVDADLQFTLTASGAATKYASIGGSGATNLVLVPNGGNVGIGTSSPQVKLHVLNSAVGGTYYGQLTVEQSGECAIQIKGSSYSSIYFSDAANPYEAGIVFDHTTNNLELRGSGNTVDLNIASTGAATFSSSVTATSFFESSDSRLKTLIQDNYQTKGIASITPKLYTKNGKVELGYYAQDFVGILDSAVSKGSDDMLSLSYREVHTAKIYALEQRIKELETK